MQPAASIPGRAMLVPTDNPSVSRSLRSRLPPPFAQGRPLRLPRSFFYRNYSLFIFQSSVFNIKQKEPWLRLPGALFK